MKETSTCAQTTKVVSWQQTPPVVFSPRIWALIDYLLQLDPDLRHTLVLNCRGREPWEIERHVTKKRIELRPAE